MYITDSIIRSCFVSQQKLLFRISMNFPEEYLNSIYFGSSFSSFTEVLLSKSWWVVLLDFSTWTSSLFSIELLIFRVMEMFHVPIANAISKNLILCYFTLRKIFAFWLSHIKHFHSFYRLIKWTKLSHLNQLCSNKNYQFLIIYNS